MMVNIGFVFSVLIFFSFLILIFGQIGFSNCFASGGIDVPQNPDAFTYLASLGTVMFSPCSGIPSWLTFLILIPLAITIGIVVIELLPFT